jgi:hypothetical protein
LGLIPGIGFIGKAGQLSYADISIAAYRQRTMNSGSAYAFYTGYPSTTGRLILYCFESNYNLDLMANAANVGFTKLGAWGGTGTSLEVYYHIVGTTNLSNQFQLGNIVENVSMITIELTGFNPVNIFGPTASYNQPYAAFKAQQCPGVTTTIPKSFILSLIGARDGSWMGNEASGWTNANLASLSELTEANYDFTHEYAAKGIKITAGATGITTVTTVTSTPALGVTIAINPLQL